MLALLLTAGILVIMAACGNASDESDVTKGKQQGENVDRTNDSSNRASKTKAKETEGDNAAKEDPEISNVATDEEKEDIKEKRTAPNEKKRTEQKPVSLKEKYLKKLKETKVETDQKVSSDESTYALKNLEGERFAVWDGLLNEIYKELENQLPTNKMDQLRIEQRSWLDYRDRTAKKASLKYEGGTMEQLEYVAVENILTEERCFKLVENYMK